MEALDYMMYCLGSSAVMLAAATSIRLVSTVVHLRNKQPNSTRAVPAPMVLSEEEADLHKRLASMRSTRYSSSMMPFAAERAHAPHGAQSAIPRPPLPPPPRIRKIVHPVASSKPLEAKKDET